MGYGRDGLAETGQWGQDLKTTFTSGSCLYFVLFFFFFFFFFFFGGGGIYGGAIRNLKV